MPELPDLEVITRALGEHTGALVVLALLLVASLVVSRVFLGRGGLMRRRHLGLYAEDSPVVEPPPATLDSANADPDRSPSERIEHGLALLAHLLVAMKATAARLPGGETEEGQPLLPTDVQTSLEELEDELERSRGILVDLRRAHDAGLGELGRVLEDLRSRAAVLERELLQLSQGGAD
jgi:hypothetical protein